MTHPELEDRLYTSSEVAKLLGVSLRSLYRYIKSSKLVPETTTLSGRHRFSKDQIEKFLYPERAKGTPPRWPEGTPRTVEEPAFARASTSAEALADRSADGLASEEGRGEEDLKPIADDGEIAEKDGELTPPTDEEAEEPESEPEKPQIPQIPEEKPIPLKPPSEEDLEKLRLEALKKVSGEQHKGTSEVALSAANGTPRTVGGPREVPEAPDKPEEEAPDFGRREEKVFEVKEPPKEEEGLSSDLPTDSAFVAEAASAKEAASAEVGASAKEGSPSVASLTSEALAKEVAKEDGPLNGFSHFDKKCQYFYSPVGDLKQIAQKIHQFAANAGKKYAFTLLAGLSLHQEVPPFSLIHIYLKEADLAFFKGVLKLAPKPKEEANIGILFESDDQFWDKIRIISDYHVAPDKRLSDDLSVYSSETRELAEGFKPSGEAT